MSMPNMADLLGPAWFGNATVRPVVVLLRRAAGSRDRGIVTPGGWAPIALPATYTVQESTSPAGDSPQQKLPGGDRVEDGMMMLLPSPFPVRTTVMVGDLDADVLQWRGKSYRVTAAYEDETEVGVTSVTAQRIQPRNLPGDLPAPPP